MSAADAFCVTKGRGLPRAGHHQAEQADQMEHIIAVALTGSVATILAHDARGRWASSARLTAHAALSNKSAMTTAWPRIS